MVLSALGGISNVDSLEIENSPNNGTLVDLDTIQLYTNYAGGSANIGTTYVNATPSSSNCGEEYSTSDGAYSSPVPVNGAPIQYRKVYFNGNTVDSRGCQDGGSTNSYFAYFACSNPVQQDCSYDDCSYNSRNETYGVQDGIVTSWEFF